MIAVTRNVRDDRQQLHYMETAIDPRSAMSAAKDPGVAGRLQSLSPAQSELLVRRLMERRMAPARSRTISPREGDGPAPLSYAQELLWLASQVFEDGIAYSAPGSFQLADPRALHVPARALEGLAERRSILRTTYRLIG